MLSNITNYLFGGYQTNDNTEKENVHFQEVEDDDWMVIDKLGGKHSNDDDDDDIIVSSETYYKPGSQNSRPPIPEKCASRRRSISCKRLVNRRCSTPLRELSPSCVNTKALVPYVPRKESRSSSKSSSYGMEESWYITPPPCFVSGPYETKPSSLENLLIEQPGINFLNNLEKQRRNRDDAAETGTVVAVESNLSTRPQTTKNQKKDTGKVPKEKNSPQSEDKRKQILEIHEQKKFINLCQSQLHSSQKIEQKAPSQLLKRNQMERMNKVQYELSSRKKRQRRADLNKKHSGVNNNRKCCY